MMRTRLELPLAVLAFLLTGCPMEDDDDVAPLPPFEDAALDEYEIAVEADASVFVDLMALDLEPMVMVNLMVYRDEAVGEGFEGMTGQEAYSLYADAIDEIQAEIGSRLIWVGGVDAQVVGTSDPVFQAVALLEYASSDAFLGFAQSIPAEASAARAAGLEGQWAIVATTVAEDDGALGAGSDCPSWSASDAADATGLSESQATQLLDGPADESVVVLELLRSTGDLTELDAYLDAMATVQDELGARLRWRGDLVLQVIGTASPGFELVLATEYPSRDCYLTALADERVTSLAQERADGADVHWIYAALDVDAGDMPR